MAFFSSPPGVSDTITSATYVLLFYLSRNLKVDEKLAPEIRGAGFETAANIRVGPTLSRYVYLRASITETLRLSPPVTGALWRERDPPSTLPIIVDGHVVPPGTQVGVSTYALYHNAEFFPEPFRFLPDRWLTDDETALRRMDSAFATFSVGPEHVPASQWSTSR